MNLRDDVYVYYVDLPAGVNEMVRPCSDGYTVYIDVNLDPDRMQKVYDHAIRHIENGDFEKTDVQQIEADAHREDGEI